MRDRRKGGPGAPSAPRSAPSIRSGEYRRRRPGLVPSAVAAILGSVLLSLPLGLDGSTTAASVPLESAPRFTLVHYASTVDAFPLTFLEWVPAAAQAGTPAPLLVYLHGLAGAGADIVAMAGGRSALAAALQTGAVVISLNTRTPYTYYVDSPFTGPGEQDVLDALAVEQARHPIDPGRIFVFGSSMGSIGAWSLAGHHPGLIRGIGVVAECTDLFAMGYWQVAHHLAGAMLYLRTTGGALPNQSAYALGQTYYLSSMRYFPENYSGILLYAVQGGNDLICPNNPHLFPYAASNNTFLVSTCRVVSIWNQPPNCQVPFSALSAAHPSQFVWRYVYEPVGVHTLNDLNGADMVSFFLGRVGPGVYCATMGGVPGSCP